MPFKASLLPRFGNAARIEVRMAATPTSLRCQPETVEIEIDDRGRVKRQQLADDQSADNRNSKRMAQFGAFAEANRQRQRPEHRRHRRHHDRTETFEAGLIDRIARAEALAAL